MEPTPTNNTSSVHPPSKPSSVPPQKAAKSRRQPVKRADTANKASEATVTPTRSPASTASDQGQRDSRTLAPRHGPPLLYPYPVPAYHYIMNHNYSLNGSPFTQPPAGGSYSSQPSPGSTNGSSGPGMPGQYTYSMHHNSYQPAPTGFSPAGYPTYAPQMMMYGAPRTNAPHDLSRGASSGQQSPAPTNTANPSKRKRKSTADSTQGRGDKDSDHEGGSGSDRPRQQGQSASAAAAAEMKKRTKTQRACDSCRSRKIRCDILSDAEPPSCQHCKQYGFECTFFLPITETRFKKKKTEDNVDNQEKEKSATRDTHSPHGETKRDQDPRVFGPTTAVHLLHSQATISSRIYESYDQRWHHTWEVAKAGDGLIRVEEPPSEDQPAPVSKPVDMRIERDIIERLLNAYFTDIAPILPIITQQEFLANPSPPPILLYSMCLVAAARRDVPQGVFDTIRYMVNGLIKAEDILSTASIVNVQALLILCMVGDCHSQFVPTALSALWIRLGTAIRMAQDLGLHRAESVQQNVQVRRRIWGACVISDRWLSLTYGHPHMIDVHDCDARLPSSGLSNDLYMDELVKLSILLGRVLKTVYSPSGLTLTSDSVLQALHGDLEAWKTNLPEDLKFHGSDTPRNAGLLHLLYSCVCMLFWRVFMRISYSCPSHLKFHMTVEHWSGLVQMTGEGIDWLNANERMYDIWMVVAYAATSAALVQYHTWTRRKDVDAVAKLRTLRDCIRRWEGSISPDHMSARRKTAEIITLLYEATQGPPLPIDEPPALNPTGGVIGKAPPPVNGLRYQKDPSRQGSGVFVAHGVPTENYRDAPEGLIIQSRGSKDGENAEAEYNTSTAGEMPSSAGIVNITPLSGDRAEGSMPNVNPAMDAVMESAAGHVQVMNVLDGPQAPNVLEQLAMTDTGFLEGIPGGMFDWGQWDNFFSRFNPSASDGSSGIPPGFRQPTVPDGTRP